MLDQHALGQAVSQFVAAAPCQVQVTDELLERYAQEGVAPSLPHDKRRFARLRLPFPNRLAAILFRPTYPSLRRDDQWHGAYLTNASRGGYQLLYQEQLFPGERLSIITSNGKSSNGTIAYCRRVTENCFECGVKRRT